MYAYFPVFVYRYDTSRVESVLPESWSGFFFFFVWNHIIKRNRSVGTCTPIKCVVRASPKCSDPIYDNHGFDPCRELAEKPLTSCCIYININPAMESIWWTIEGALSDDVICWSAPQSQAGLLDRPHLHISALKRPTPVRSLLSLTQACRGRSDPGQHVDGEIIYSRSLLVDGCHSADHILAIHWAFVSLGRGVDRRSLPLVAKGRQVFSLGCVSSLVMVWWRKWSGSMAWRARAKAAIASQPASQGSFHFLSSPIGWENSSL